MSEFNKLIDNFSKLKLDIFTEELINEYSNKLDDDICTILVEATNKEIKFKEDRAKQQMIKTAAFPVHRTLDEYDFTFNSSVDKNKILYLGQLEFLTNKENIVFVGSPGVGKTHLSIGIGINAATIRTSTYFIKCKRLLEDLVKAHSENRLEVRLKHYNKYKLLIIDEIGFLPIKELEAKILFQLIDMRYEKKSTIVTTNILLEKWSDIFNDPVIANAILDRLLHHSHIFKITGESYRMKDLFVD